jgi:DNA-binding transcriptional ArsR family regulator
MKKLLFVVATCLFAMLLTDLKAQEGEWEFYKMQRREKQKQRELDSIMVHLKNRWEIKLTYGRWKFF